MSSLYDSSPSSIDAEARKKPTIEEHRFPCESCGSDLRFSPDARQLDCDHCGHTQALEHDEIARNAIVELDFNAALKNQLPENEMEETRIINCQSCGAQVEFDSKTQAKECPFCATPIVTDTGVHRHIKPKGLLPFILSEKQAHNAMMKWLGSLWFAPNGLKEYARAGRKLNGIYVPYWTYDADTKSSYKGMRGTYYYVTKTRIVDGRTEHYQERRIRWTHVSGRVKRWFDDILVLASKSLPKKYTDALKPWDLTALEPYRPDYLAGFQAEAYQVALDTGFDEARQIIEAQIIRDVRFDIGGDQQKIMQLDTTINDVTFKHILLPVWMAAYKYRGRSYRFVVNGQTARVQGERPYSAIKIAFAVLFGLMIGGAIGYFIAMNQ